MITINQYFYHITVIEVICVLQYEYFWYSKSILLTDLEDIVEPSLLMEYSYTDLKFSNTK